MISKWQSLIDSLYEEVALVNNDKKTPTLWDVYSSKINNDPSFNTITSNGDLYKITYNISLIKHDHIIEEGYSTDEAIAFVFLAEEDKYFVLKRNYTSYFSDNKPF